MPQRLVHIAFIFQRTKKPVLHMEREDPFAIHTFSMTAAKLTIVLLHGLTIENRLKYCEIPAMSRQRLFYRRIGSATEGGDTGGQLFRTIYLE
jgi:hypothetical protein